MIAGKQLEDFSVQYAKLDIILKGGVKAVATSVPAEFNTGLPTNVDGVTSWSAGDRILIAVDSDTDNGIWVVAAGAWSRAVDLPEGASASAILVPVDQGDTFAKSLWVCQENSGSDVVGTDAISFSVYPSGVAESSMQMISGLDGETPASGVADELPTGLSLTNTPLNGSYPLVFLNGAFASVGDGVKTKDCYFSADGGTTAKSLSEVEAGDQLIWNAVLSGTTLGGTEALICVYPIAYPQIASS